MNDHPPWWKVRPRGREVIDGTVVVYCVLCDAPLACATISGRQVPPAAGTPSHPCRSTHSSPAS